MYKYAIELKWGINFFVASLLWMLLERLIGLHSVYISEHYIYTNIFAVIAILIFVFALLDKRKNFYEGVMTWKQGFLSGLIITLIVVILSPLAQIITHEIITPEFFPNIIEYTVEQGQMTLEEAEAYFNLGNYIIQSMIGGFVMGLITSAIVAFFVKKR